MTSAARHITVNVFEKEFRFTCLPHEEQQLLAAADHINQWMEQQIEEEGLSGENIATMAALNMASQLLELQKSQHGVEATSQRIKQALSHSNERNFVTRIGADL